VDCEGKAVGRIAEEGGQTAWQGAEESALSGIQIARPWYHDWDSSRQPGVSPCNHRMAMPAWSPLYGSGMMGHSAAV